MKNLIAALKNLGALWWFASRRTAGINGTPTRMLSILKSTNVSGTPKVERMLCRTMMVLPSTPSASLQKLGKLFTAVANRCRKNVITAVWIWIPKFMNLTLIVKNHPSTLRKMKRPAKPLVSLLLQTLKKAATLCHMIWRHRLLYQKKVKIIYRKMLRLWKRLMKKHRKHFTISWRLLRRTAMLLYPRGINYLLSRLDPAVLFVRWILPMKQTLVALCRDLRVSNSQPIPLFTNVAEDYLMFSS
mmetsp:Transcript_20012/g.24505  ORF Transcript_20012/g.24505 Transcript_20012/m.24505 type:complete len:244 (+) Transcript_20012:646-1377(+)